MKILQVVPYFYPAWAYGGPAKLVYDTSCFFAAQGHEVTIYTSDGYDKEKRMPLSLHIHKKGIKVHYFKNIHNTLAYVYNLFFTPGLFVTALLELPKFDVIHIHDFYTLQNFWVGLLARVFHIPYILSVHGCLEEVRMGQRSFFKQFYIYLYGKQLLLHATKVIASSENEKNDYIKHGVKGENCILLAHGVSASEFTSNISQVAAKKQFGLSSHKQVITFLGRIHAVKGLDLLVSALPYLKNKEYTVVIAGSDDGYQQELEKLVLKMKLHNVVKLLPACFGSQKADLFKATDVFVYPSYSEGFSLGILEAASVGLPLVITEGCHFPLVGKMKAGIVVAPDKKRLANALDELLSDKNKRSEYGKNAAKLIAQKYSMEYIGQILLTLYASTY